MKIVIFIHDIHFLVTESGDFYFPDSLSEKYFDRFFSAGANHVYILSRTSIVDHLDRKCTYKKVNTNTSIRLLDPKFSYLSLLSPVWYFKFSKLFEKADLMVYSVPSVTSLFVSSLFGFKSTRYSIELAGDLDMFKTKPGGWLISKLMFFCFPRFIYRAKGVAYVSNFLKEKFPTSGYSITSSNVNIDNIVLREPAPDAVINKNKFKIGFVGALTLRKGFDLIVSLCEQLSLLYGNFEIVLIGANKEYSDFPFSSERYRNIKFLGSLQHDEVRKELDSFDLYIQPSRSEGVPRATIEAMSRGLPVVSSDIPGFIDLGLRSDNMFKSGDHADFLLKVVQVLTNVEKYNLSSKENSNLAANFIYERLHNVRVGFYKKLL